MAVQSLGIYKVLLAVYFREWVIELAGGVKDSLPHITFPAEVVASSINDAATKAKEVLARHAKGLTLGPVTVMLIEQTGDIFV